MAIVLKAWQVVILAFILLSLLCVGVTEAHASSGAIFGPVDHTYNLSIMNHTYPIRWGTLGNGTVEYMQANYTAKSIRVIISDNRTDQGGLFFIELPRNVIDAIAHYAIGNCDYCLHDVLYSLSVSRVSGEPMPSPAGYNIAGGYDEGGEITNDTARTLAIFCPTGDTVVVIQGTVMVPEFQSFPESMVMATAAAGVVVMRIATKYKLP